MLRLAVERDDGHLGRTRLHDLEVLRGNRRVRLGDPQRLVGRHLRAHDLDDLRRQMAAEVERHEAARLEHAHEAAVARQERALVVLDDNLELEQHDTVSNPFLVISLSPSLRGEAGVRGSDKLQVSACVCPSP